MAFETPSCDLCGQMAHTTLFPATPGIESKDPAGFYSSSRAYNGHFSIIRCKICGLVRSFPRDDLYTRNHLYTHLRDDIYEGEENNRIVTFSRRSHSISQHLLEGTRLLDIGCSTGLFVNEAVRLGWQAHGIDPSEWAIEIARQRIPSAQFRVAAIETANFPEKFFNIITLWDVLEHTDSPRSVLKRLSAWLVPSGQILLNLPDINSFEARLLGERWPMLLREHLWYFSPKTLKRLLEETGFEVTSLRPNKVHFSIKTIGRRLSQYPGWIGKIGHLIRKMRFSDRLSFWFSTGEMEVTALLKDSS